MVGGVGAEALGEEFEVDDFGGVEFGEAVEEGGRGFEVEGLGLGGGGGGDGAGGAEGGGGVGVEG